MKITASIILLIVSVMVSFSAPVYPARTNGNNTFYGTNFHQKHVVIQGTNALFVGDSGTNIIRDSGSSIGGVLINSHQLRLNDTVAAITVTNGSKYIIVTNGTYTANGNINVSGSSVTAYSFRMDNGYFGSAGAATAGFAIQSAAPPMLKMVDNNGNPYVGVVCSNVVFSYPRWVDEKVSGIALRVGGSSPVRTLVESGTGIYGTGFNAGEDVDFSMQWSHGTASTNTIFTNFVYTPHLHISPTSIASGTNCAFKITYQISSPYVTFSNSIVTLTNWVTFTNTSMHHLLSFGPVTNNLLQGKDSIVARGNISCLTNNTGARVILDSADFHIPVDSVGSSAVNGD